MRDDENGQSLLMGSCRYIRSTIPLDELELRARYPPVDAIGRPLITSHPKGIAGAFGE